MPNAQTAHALTTYFVSQYKAKFDQKPSVNRNTARWGWDSMLLDFDVDEIKELIDYYLTTASASSHNLKWFFYNYELLVESKNQQKANIERLEEIREQTRIRTEEWRKRIGNNGSQTD